MNYSYEDILDWPKRWMGVKEDIEPGTNLLISSKEKRHQFNI